jgi:HPt (histidine-containing phosphotransfer) domain-containing protein
MAELQRELALVRRSAPPRGAWDEQKALANSGGDPNLLHELAAVFLHESPKLVQQLLEAAGAEEWSAVKSSAHALKGELLCLGAPSAAEAARLVEIHACEVEGNQCRNKLHELMDEVQRVRAALEKYNSAAVASK